MNPQLRSEFISILEIMGNASLSISKDWNLNDGPLNQAIVSLAARQAEICNILAQLLKEGMDD